MKRLLLLILLIPLVFCACDRPEVWTVKTVPNTRLQNNAIHVSDPDNFLSDSAERSINTALSAIRDKADVFVVTLASIGDAEPKHFATELFNDWGVGNAATNNGVLLLFVEDQHALEIEIGYGMEEVLTDAKCERIFNKVIKPCFVDGEYEKGLCTGVAAIVSTLGCEVPDGLLSLVGDQSFIGNAAAFDKDDEEGKIPVVWSVLGLLALVLIIDGIAISAMRGKKVRKEYEKLVQKTTEGDGTICYEIKEELKEAKVVTGISTGKKLWTWFYSVALPILEFFLIYYVLSQSALGKTGLWVLTSLFFVLVILLRTVVSKSGNKKVLAFLDQEAKHTPFFMEVYSYFWRKHLKATEYCAPWLGLRYGKEYLQRIQEEDLRCPTCGGVMQKDDTAKLSDLHEKEKEIGTKVFNSYRCEQAHVVLVSSEGDNYDKYYICEHCGGRTAKVVESMVTKEPTNSTRGEREDSCECLYCGQTMVKKVVLLSKTEANSHGSSGGGSSGGGSFGGGSSGGGGYSGRW